MTTTVVKNNMNNKDTDSMEDLKKKLEDIKGDSKCTNTPENFYVFGVFNKGSYISVSTIGNCSYNFISNENGTWDIETNYRNGFYYNIGKIKDYKNYTLSEGFRDIKIPENHIKYLKKYIDVIQEHIKPNSIKFITSRVLAKLKGNI